jgi:CheY-like chemotaxis protein
MMYESEKRPVAILMADDDPDDRFLTKHAFTEHHVANPLLFVEDGVELLDYLRGAGKYADRVRFPLPGLILLDLNMPRSASGDQEERAMETLPGGRADDITGRG